MPFNYLSQNQCELQILVVILYGVRDKMATDLKAMMKEL